MKTTPNSRDLERAVRAHALRNPGRPIFLVGGAIRDRLLGRRRSDFDFALRSGESDLARKLESLGFGRAIQISSEESGFPVWRLAAPGLCVDIARFENADSIERDLLRRDFTVNAIARDAVSGRLVDPCGGMQDLARSRIRMVSPRNLDADPIRVLRAYRLAATLGWSIEKRTRAALARRAPRLSAEARERVHSELVRLFDAPEASRAVGWAEQDGVLASCLGLPRRRRLAAARLLARFDGRSGPKRDRFSFRIATLLFRSRINKSRVAGLLGEHGFSRRESSTIALEVGFLAAAFSDTPLQRVLFDFRDHWTALRPLVRLAARNKSEVGRSRRLQDAARRCRFGPAPVDGHDVARWLGIPPGKELGQALERARFLYFTGEVRTPEEIEDAVRAFDRARGVR
jgi:tRNA nucleotidyltransferase/poly(A) polymerase